MDHAPWEDPPRRPELQPDRLDLWLVALAAEPGKPARQEGLLSHEETLVARRFALPAARRRWIRARAALKTILGAYLRQPPRALRLATGPAGKPCLDGLQFNLSHAGDLALVAVSKDKQAGVDIENLREPPALREVVAHIFTAEERRFVELSGEEQRARAFFLIWNRREAAAKALGMDLLASYARLEVPVADCPPKGFLVSLSKGEEWWLRDLCPAPGYVGALCLEGGPAELAWWRYRG